MIAPTPLLLALAAAAATAQAEPQPAPGGSSPGLPGVVGPEDYADTVVGVLVGGRVERASGEERRAAAIQVVADSHLRAAPAALRIVAELAEDGALAEIGVKVFLAAAPSLRLYGAVCAGGALRSGVAYASGSVAAGLELRAGRAVLAVQLEARSLKDPDEVRPDRVRAGALAGVAVAF